MPIYNLTGAASKAALAVAGRLAAAVRSEGLMAFWCPLPRAGLKQGPGNGQMRSGADVAGSPGPGRLGVISSRLLLPMRLSMSRQWNNGHGCVSARGLVFGRRRPISLYKYTRAGHVVKSSAAPLRVMRTRGGGMPHICGGGLAKEEGCSTALLRLVAWAGSAPGQ